MEAIIEELLAAAVDKLKKFADGVCINEEKLNVSKKVVIDCYHAHQDGGGEWSGKQDDIVATRGSETVQVLCLMFELTVLRARTVAAVRLLNNGLDAKADNRIRLIDAALEFGRDMSNAISRSKALTKENKAVR